MKESYLEDSLHLGQMRPWVLSGEHLDDQAANTPDIGLERVRLLLDDLRRHPEHGALKRWTVCTVARKQICRDVSIDDRR